MTTLQIDYNLDVAGAQRLEAELASVVVGDGEEIVIDLSGVAFVASSGLRILLKWGQQFDRDGTALVLENPNDTVKSVLDMSGFSDILTVR